MKNLILTLLFLLPPALNADVVVETPANIPELVYNVQDYGAIPDDSNDDRAAIQNAIASIPSDGGTLYFPPGQYDVSVAADATDGMESGLFINRSNITLWISDGSTLRLMDSQVSGSDTFATIRIGDDNTLSNIRIVGRGTIDGNDTTNTSSASINERAGISAQCACTDLEFSDFTITGVDGTAVVIEQDGAASRAERVSVINLRVLDSGEGIEAIGVNDWKVHDNFISGIEEQDGIEPVETRNFSIVGNVLQDIAQSGIDIFDAAEVGVVSGNALYNVANTSGDGITWGGDGNAVTKLVIDGNVLDTVGAGATGNGINSLQDDTYENTEVILSNNHISNANLNGIKVWSTDDNVIINGNLIYNSGLNGIDVKNNNFNIANNTIFNNGQDTSSDGIFVTLSSAGMIANNYIFDDQATATQRYGINIGSTASNIDVFGNLVFGHSSYGAFVDGDSNRIKYNTIYNNDEAATVQNVRVTGDANHFFGNDVADTKGTPDIDYGLNIIGDNNIALYNYVHGHANTDVRDAGTSNTTTHDPSTDGNY